MHRKNASNLAIYLVMSILANEFFTQNTKCVMAVEVINNTGSQGNEKILTLSSDAYLTPLSFLARLFHSDRRGHSPI